MKKNKLAEKYHCKISELRNKCFEKRHSMGLYIQIKGSDGISEADCLLLKDDRFKAVQRVNITYDDIADNYDLITNDYFDNVFDRVLKRLVE